MDFGLQFAGSVAELKPTSERSFEFACRLVDEFRRQRPADMAEWHVWHELIRAGTSVAANTSEAGGAGSPRDFGQKFQIALKEAREALMWLRLAKHAAPDRRRQLDALYKECDTIVAILVSSLKTVKKEHGVNVSMIVTVLLLITALLLAA